MNYDAAAALHFDYIVTLLYHIIDTSIYDHMIIHTQVTAQSICHG